ncbi:hypothetical protein [Snodgrassella alvi]|uniref:hypothetical protein n=1 Tax=Snodgrassella alvi TaxID=1196083 RepID=UPI003460C778
MSFSCIEFADSYLYAAAFGMTLVLRYDISHKQVFAQITLHSPVDNYQDCTK